MYVCFINLEKSFEACRKHRESFRKAGDRQKGNKISKKCITNIGVKQGCVLCPLLFLVEIDKATREAKQTMFKIKYWKMEQIELTELMFADYMSIDAGKNRPA